MLSEHCTEIFGHLTVLKILEIDDALEKYDINQLKLNELVMVVPVDLLESKNNDTFN